MKKIFLINLFLFFLFISYGQNNKWLNYLNGEMINEITQQSSTLWIGTVGGLVKLDLTTNDKTFFNKANSGLPSNNILSLAVSGNELWIGTDNGLVKYENNSWTLYNTSNSLLPSNCINKISVKSSNIYIATPSGLAIYNESNSLSS